VPNLTVYKCDTCNGMLSLAGDIVGPDVLKVQLKAQQDFHKSNRGCAGTFVLVPPAADVPAATPALADAAPTDQAAPADDGATKAARRSRSA
jgi:hypothetical protein